VHAAVAIANRRAGGDQARDLVSRRRGARFGAVGGDEPQRLVAAGRRHPGHREAILLDESKRVGAAGALRHLVADVVHEGQQRRHGPEAARDRATHVPVRPQRLEIPACFIEH
jgi:hypothetical protein